MAQCGLKKRLSTENDGDKKEITMIKKTVAALFSVLLLSSLLSACNTTRGVGEDIQAGGSAISGAANHDQQ